MLMDAKKNLLSTLVLLKVFTNSEEEEERGKSKQITVFFFGIS
jgi:hypothetical protein